MKEPVRPGAMACEENIFNAAVQLTDAAERGACLDQACAGDTELRARMEKLLAAAHDPFFNIPVRPSRLTPSEAKTATMDFYSEAPTGRIGRYKLLEKIGEGGCGVVYMAEQEEPVRRRVALKVIKLGMDTRNVISRFEAERQALAMMDHPNIAKVLDAGATEAGRPFFVMELVRGTRITRYCDQNNLTTRERLALFMQVCHAIQHAHQKGIIHRDIKPSNILVTLHDGVPVPKVIDFGIAKATTDQRLTDKTLFTALEQFIGTPAYMSPEQAEMSGLDIDTRSDIYGLGVLLYELLTGGTPFNSKELLASGVDEMRRIIREKEPVRPSTKISQSLAPASSPRKLSTPHPSLSTDLDWIVMKCLEKDRTRRYETANGLANDIQRHLNNDAVLARPPSAAYRLQKMIRRNKLSFAAAAAVAIVLLLGVIVSTWQALRATRAEREQTRLHEDAVNARANEVEQRHKAERERERAQAQAYASDMNRVQHALAESDLGQARQLLDRHRSPAKSEGDWRGWEWRYLWQRCRGDMEFSLYRKWPATIYYAGFLSDATRVVTFADTGRISLWDLPTRTEIVRLQDHVPGVREIANSGQARLSNDGELLAAASRTENGQPSIKVWKTSTSELLAEIPGDDMISSVNFSADKQKLAAFTPQKAVEVWNLSTKEVELRLPAAKGNSHAGAVAFSPDRALLAIGDGDGRVRLVDLAAKVEFPAVKTFTDGIMALAFSPNGRSLAVGAGYYDAAITVWDVRSRTNLAVLRGHKGWIAGLTFSQDGKTLFSASADATLKLWDTAAWKEKETLLGHAEEVWTVAISNDGKKLVSGGKDAAVNIWPASKTRLSEGALDVAEREEPWDVSPDSARLAAIGRDGIISVWNADSGEKQSLLPALGTNNAAVFWSSAGEILAGSLEPTQIRIWNLTNSTLTTHPLDPGGTALHWRLLPISGKILIGAHPGGSLIGLGGTNWTFSRWDIRTRKEDSRLKVNQDVTAITVSADERLLVIGTEHGDILLLNLETGHQETSFKAHTGSVLGLALSPDGTFLMTSEPFPSVTVWDLAARKVLTELRGHKLVIRWIAISPDGSRMATASIGQEPIKIWDTRSWEELAKVGSGLGRFFIPRFLPDGNTLAAQDGNQTLHLWRAPSWGGIVVAEANAKAEIEQASP